MIDFDDGFTMMLAPMEKEDITVATKKLFTEDEEVIEAYKAGRDYCVFTNKRIITIDSKGLMNKSTDYTTLPYSKLVSYSIEMPSADNDDDDIYMSFFFIGMGQITLEFKSDCDVYGVCEAIEKYLL